MKETGEAHWKTQPSLLTAVVLVSGENRNYDGTFSSIGTYGYCGVLRSQYN
jgi:hypothetical protein